MQTLMPPVRRAANASSSVSTYMLRSTSSNLDTHGRGVGRMWVASAMIDESPSTPLSSAWRHPFIRRGARVLEWHQRYFWCYRADPHRDPFMENLTVMHAPFYIRQRTLAPSSLWRTRTLDRALEPIKASSYSTPASTNFSPFIQANSLDPDNQNNGRSSFYFPRWQRFVGRFNPRDRC